MEADKLPPPTEISHGVFIGLVDEFILASHKREDTTKLEAYLKSVPAWKCGSSESCCSFISRGVQPKICHCGLPPKQF